ncbi:MAG: DNA repair protein RecO [Firmicutes bacterium HGW-Firmicutes-20]|nr:MAG: DNA repair protein RecO [Firmicutes bacterium HGW-Firmicutes-20]PKM66060.1 MAG: DNA repair protein RecO [Firmicutes bacterium HGW-Firmicutes-19]
MNDRLEAIILRVDPYKETDGLLQVLGKEHGKMTILAKGILKGSSKNAASVQPITHCDMVLDIKEPISLLHSASIIDFYRFIKEDITRLSVASLICEIAMQVSTPYQPDEYLYDITKESLAAFKSYPPILIGCLYVSLILKEMGISPMVDGCVVCDETKVSAISISEGGFVCLRCAKNVTSKAYDASFSRLFRYTVKAQWTNISALAKQGEFTLDLLAVFVDFFKDYTSIPLKSWEFLRKL